MVGRPENEVTVCYSLLHDHTSSRPSEAMGVLVTRGSAGSRVSGAGVFSEASRCGRGLSSSSGCRRREMEREGRGEREGG